MKTTLMICFLILCPLILGLGALTTYNKIALLLSKDKKPAPKKPLFVRLCDYFSFGIILFFLIAGLSNAVSVFLSYSFDKSIRVFAVFLIIFLTVFYFLFIIWRFFDVLGKNAGKDDKSSVSTVKTETFNKKIYTVLISLSCLFSVGAILVAVFGKIYINGDQTLETVNSFLSTNQMYSVNPLTGLPYDGDFPARLKYMFLPFFYSVLCHTFDVDTMLLLYRIIPVYYLFAGYTIFVTIGDTLFKEKNKKVLFYLVSVFLIFCAGTSTGSIEFDIFHTGYRSGAFLIFIIVNVCASMILKKRFVACILPIVLEPLCASTRFGVGACFVMTLVCFILYKITSRNKKEAANE
ncbi:MAG: hypothetical protein K5669_10795 [Lachnospiraceae bacterium]|nr:hypothetical protein [Lachnospiraceae bacterium]